jgi:CheY-like chemotaxis protein
MNSSTTAARSSQLHSQPVPPLVLVIEDSDEDYEALRRAFKQSPIPTRLHRCHTGKQALDYLAVSVQTTTACAINIPALILLDLNLPGIDGRKVLETLKQDPVWQYIPTLVLTTSNYVKDIEECYRLGANSYLLKAIDLQQFKKSIHTTIEFWLDIAKLPKIADVVRVQSQNLID